MNIKFNLDNMTLTQLAQLYVLLCQLNEYVQAGAVYNAGLANSGGEAFDAEVKRVKGVMS